MRKFTPEIEEKVQKAVDRLNTLLPLKKRQSSLNASMQALHKEILSSYVDIGRSMTKVEMAERVNDVEKAIDIFKKNDLVVFDDSGELTGAYPFTMEKRLHKLNVQDWPLHCMCALDALAVSPMFNKAVDIASKCHISHQAVNISQNGFEVVNRNEVSDLHFGINWGSASNSCCCADSLCTEMIFLKGNELAKGWVLEDPVNRESFSLDEAIEFSAQFFMPLMQ